MTEQDPLLDAAASEFARHGYAGSSLASIAARVGLTKGALARRYPTKEKLAWEIVAALRAIIDNERRASLDAYPASGIRATVRFLLAMGNAAASNACMSAGVVLFTDRTSPVFGVIELAAGWRDSLQAFIELAQAEGEVPAEVDAHQFAQHMFVTTLGAAVLDSRLVAAEPESADLSLLAFMLRKAGVNGVEEIINDVASTLAHGTLPSVLPYKPVPSY